MLVHVLGMDVDPLDPTHPAKARILLKQKKLSKFKWGYCVLAGVVLVVVLTAGLIALKQNHGDNKSESTQTKQDVAVEKKDGEKK